ncbi:hypothetical protein [Bradyrhizobium sp. CCBAU 53415]|uniref:hypothetical protein n=1 Tax=Bradyrhizobium sp. CCBAU 53415 TaxID=1325119 RepID=UPI00230575B3|nr:hypothetical protein [Bradyrhizobium sp. CCBAU 53415]
MIYVEKLPPETPEERRRAKEERERRRIEKLVRDAKRRQRYLERLKNEPNKVYLPELIGAALLVIVLSTAGTFGTYWLFQELSPVLTHQPKWASVVELALCAIFVGYVAWYLREARKAKLYPVVEIALGSTLSVQGLILDSTNFSLLASVVAFVGGVRIIIDGFKRLFEYRTFHLVRPGFYEYYWRKVKRAARWVFAPSPE